MGPPSFLPLSHTPGGLGGQQLDSFSARSLRYTRHTTHTSVCVSPRQQGKVGHITQIDTYEHCYYEHIHTLVCV